MESMLAILIILVVIQTTLNILMFRGLKKAKSDRKVINLNLDKSAKLIKYLLDKLKGRDIINKN